MVTTDKQPINNRETMQGKIHKHPRANTAGFDANPQNINRAGRPRRLVSTVIKDLESKGVERVSQTDVKDTFLMLINLEIEELEGITKSKKHPAIVRIVAREMLGGKGFDVIEKMLDRAIGKSEENIKVGGMTINFVDNSNNK